MPPGYAGGRADSRAPPRGKRTLQKRAGARKHLPDVCTYSGRDLLLEEVEGVLGVTGGVDAGSGFDGKVCSRE